MMRHFGMIVTCIDVTAAEDGPCDQMTELMLQSSTGSTITDVSDLKAALKKGNVVIRTK